MISILVDGFNSPFLLTRGLGSTSIAASDPDIIAAVVSQLRAYNSAEIPTALGEAGSVYKIWVDEALGAPALPWVRITEIAEPLSSESPEDDEVIHWIAEHAQIQISVFASKKTQARTLRNLIVKSLNDQDLTNDEAAVMYFRVDSQGGPFIDDVAPGQPAVYHAFATFTYFLDRVY